MRLRKLEDGDAPYMLEWMRDDSVTHYFKIDFASKQIEDCKKFIANSVDGENVHYAVTDDGSDEYLGTVSLKHIKGDCAEFAIALRKKAMGTGVAIGAMKAILNEAFGKRMVKYVYWCASPDNCRALRFYDKNGFKKIQNTKQFEQIFLMGGGIR